MWSSDFYRPLKYRGRCTIQLFQLGVWCEKCVAAQHYAVICKQLLISNDRNRVRWVVLGLSQDEDWTDLFENFSVNSWKRDLSNNITVIQPLFSLVITVKELLGKTAGAAVVKLRFHLQNWATAELSEGTDFLDKSFFLTFYRKKRDGRFPPQSGSKYLEIKWYYWQSSVE